MREPVIRMTRIEIAKRASAVDVVIDDHRQIDAALERVTSLLDGPSRELLLAHDTVVGLLSRHLLGVEIAVCPVVADHLPDGRRAIRAHLTEARRLQRTMYGLKQILWSDARAPRVSLAAMQRQLLSQMARHRDDEERMLAALDKTLEPAERASLAQKLQHATMHAPTHPHPSAVRRTGWTRSLYRLVAGVDHFRDAEDSRTVPEPLYARRRQPRVGLWSAYALGQMLPPESTSSLQPSGAATGQPPPRGDEPPTDSAAHASKPAQL